MFIATRREHDHHQPEYPARNVRQNAGLRELQRGLEQRVQHMEAGLMAANQVRSIFMPPKRRTLTLHPGDGSMGIPTVPVGSFRLGVVDEIIHDILLTQPVATRY